MVIPGSTFDLRAFAEKPALAGATAKIALRCLDNVGRYGGVTMEEGRILNFDASGADNRDGYINAGDGILRPDP